jgi:hypothetical protein
MELQDQEFELPSASADSRNFHVELQDQEM